MKIVINICHGGFGLSHEAVMLYAKLKGIKLYAYANPRDANGRLNPYSHVPYDPKKGKEDYVSYFTKPMGDDGKLDDKAYFSPDHDIERTDPFLIKAVERLGEKAGGRFAKLKVVKVPNGIKWEIHDYDGMESIHEKHRSWD